MNTVTLADWVEDLRTTHAGQTVGKLRSGFDYNFCCLGRLLDLVDPNAWNVDPNAWNHEGSAMKWKSYLINIPLDVLNGRGWMSRSQMIFASNLNDLHGFTFSEIADWAEAGMPIGADGISWVVKVNRERESV